MHNPTNQSDLGGPPARPARRFGRHGAYTLMEVMFAIAILALGLICIASLFPVGLVQSKKALDDAQGVIVGNNVIALLSTAGSGVFPGQNSGTAADNLYYPFAAPAWLTYTEPTGLYDYRVVYRRNTTTDPGAAADVAVFIYRRPSAKELSDQGITTNVLAVEATATPPDAVAPNMLTINTSVSFHLTRGRAKNQSILATATGDRGYILTPYQLVGSDSAKLTLGPATTTDTVYYLPQKAVAIVTGVIK